MYGWGGYEEKTPKSDRTNNTEQNPYQQQNSLLSTLAQKLRLRELISQKSIDQIPTIIKDPDQNLEQVSPYDIFRLACFIDQCTTILSSTTQESIEISGSKLFRKMPLLVSKYSAFC